MVLLEDTVFPGNEQVVDPAIRGCALVHYHRTYPKNRAYKVTKKTPSTLFRESQGRSVMSTRMVLRLVRSISSNLSTNEQ